MTDKPKKATAAAVSRALTDAGMAKSVSSATRIKGYRSSSWGFRATNESEWDKTATKLASTGAVTVSWKSGNFCRLDGDAEREAEQLAKAAEILTGKGFTVQTIRNGGYTTLSVTRAGHPS